MSDPRRLKDEYAGDLEGRLLRSVAGDAPRRSAHRRTLVALGFGGAALGIPAATTAAAATKVGTAVTFAVIAKWVGIGIGTAVVAAGAIYEAPRLRSPAASPVVTIDRLPAVAPLVAPPSPPIQPAPTSNDNHSGVPEINVAPPVATRPPRSSPTVGSDIIPEPAPAASRAQLPEPPGLSQEVAVLDAARQMVSTNPLGTLRVLDEYQRQFPHGDLAPEALVLRIEALVRSGQREAADKLARDYLARNPGSPHARKIRALLGGP